MTAETTLAEYSIATELNDIAIERLRDAIMSPESETLKDILLVASTTGGRGYHRTDDFEIKRQEGLDADAAGFRSEALERMVLCNTWGDRFGGLSEIGKPIWLLRDVCEKATNIYKPLQIDWDWPSIERLIRARAHAAETIGASNSLGYYWDKFDPSPLIANAPEPNKEVRERLAFQLHRLEVAEVSNREESQNTAFFKPYDVELLSKLVQVVGRASTGLSRILAEQDVVEQERRNLVDRQSPVWRDLFDALFDWRDGHDRSVVDLPEFQELAASSPLARGIAVAEAAASHAYLEQLRAGKIVLPSGVVVKDGVGGLGHPYFFVSEVVEKLLEFGPVECDDNTMANLVEHASSWRALCHPHLLDSAERTLNAGSATETIAALRRLAVKPSHCFLPSRAGGDYEGDAWWQDTPGRIEAMLASHPDPARASARPVFGRNIFGRKRP